MTFDLRNQQPAPFQPPSQPQKPNWTTGKIVALILVALLVAGVSGFAAFNYYGRQFSPTQPCSNGATNYPTCNSCSSGQTLTGGSCTNNCTNGATNPPSCTSYSACSNGANNPPACTTFNPCSNGATNPPTCNIFPTCSNGATNYPQCSMFNTATSITCNPITIETHSLVSAACMITVTSTQAPTEPTGNVGFTASGTTAWSANGAPCTLTLATGFAYCNISDVTTTGPSGTMTINAEYGGDTSHAKSTGSISLTVDNPPSTVTVSGSVSTTGLFTSPSEIEFISSAAVGYYASASSGSYSVDLPNLTTYSVIVYWVSGSFSGSCNAGTLTLEAPTSSWYANYSC